MILSEIAYRPFVMGGAVRVRFIPLSMEIRLCENRVIRDFFLHASGFNRIERCLDIRFIALRIGIKYS
jgi:hypothetical protein